MLETLKPFMPAIAGFLAFFGVLLAVLGAGMPPKRDPIEERLYRATQRTQSLEDIELQAPFMERFFQPLGNQLSKIVMRLTPTDAMEATPRKLLYAGLSGQI